MPVIFVTLENKSKLLFRVNLGTELQTCLESDLHTNSKFYTYL